MGPFGYHPVQHTPGMWVHDNRKTIFSLVVDDFFVQDSSVEYAGHFLNALKVKYIIIIDMEAKVNIGIKLNWEYVNRTVIFSMPNYDRESLAQISTNF